MTIVESPKLATRQEADEWARNFRADDVPVEIIENEDKTFTVRADYPEGDVPPVVVPAKPAEG